MPEENAPVSDDEFVLRRIPYTSNNDYYNDSLDPPFTKAGFVPHKKKDTDGLSVYRAIFTTPEDLAQSSRKPGQCYVVRIRVKSLKDLGLSVTPNPVIGGPRGHALIPELKRSEYENNKPEVSGILNQLARIGSEGIVYTPQDP